MSSSATQIAGIRIARTLFLGLGLTIFSLSAAQGAGFEVGIDEVRLDLPAGLTMWGYGPRQNQGELDPLMARAVVFSAGTGADRTRIALVTLDLGRTPSLSRLDSVRARVKERAGINDVVFNASHTHSGPYLNDDYRGDYRDGDVPAWEEGIADQLVASISRAAEHSFEARIGVGYGRSEIGFNRRFRLPDGSVRMLWENTTRVSTHPVDNEVTVIRVDDASGRVRAVLVGYACHPVIFGPDNLEYSADWPAAMVATVKDALPDRPMVAFLQGAPGDINPFQDKRLLRAGARSIRDRVGDEIGREVVRVASEMSAGVPERGEIQFVRERKTFRHRLHSNDLYQGDLTVLLLNGSIGFVGLPGEPFVEFQLDLKRRRPVEHPVLLGYTNGYTAYFPTIRAAAEGGYGADPTVARVELGAGERLMMRAYRTLLRMTGQLSERPERP